MFRIPVRLLGLALSAFVLVTSAALVVVGTAAGATALDAPGATDERLALADGAVSVIDDTAVGDTAGGVSAAGQVGYAGDWTLCGGCAPLRDGGFRYTWQSGATATIRFVGTRIDLFGVYEPTGGIAAVQIDGMPHYDVDTYSPTQAAGLTYRSPDLPYGEHTAVVTNSGRRAPGSAGFVVAFDRAEVTAGPSGTPTAEPATAESPTAESATVASSGGSAASSGERSGLPWLSGANGDPFSDASHVNSFCDCRGRACDVAQVYASRGSWDDLVRPSFAQGNFAGWPGRLVISVPPYPDGQGSNAACAGGAYDEQWREFGRTLNATGRQNSILRIAWEANGDWFPWSAWNAGEYVGCWRRIADAINSTAEPDPLLEWTVNNHLSQNPPSRNPLDLYPGDAWVDVVGIDAFDHYPPSPTKLLFDLQATAPGGITWLYDFARAHGKLFGVGEWGVASGVGGGGDNAGFVQWMWEWFQAHAGQGLLYESYFNECRGGNATSNLFRPAGDGCVLLNRSAGDTYRALW